MPRARLDRDAVVDAAVQIVEKEGLSALTFSRLAAFLGIRPPSLYNHVEGVDDLMDAVTLRAFQGLLQASQEAILGRAGWAALEALAHAQRAYAKAHPELYTATFRSLHSGTGPGPKVASDFIKLFEAALRDYGLDDIALLHTIRCLRAAVGGFIEIELRGGFGLPVKVDESFQRLLRLLANGIRYSKTRETSE